MSSVVAFLLRVSLCVWSDCRLSSAPRQIENVDACLSFLDARGVNVQGLSAEGKADNKRPTRGLSQLNLSLTHAPEGSFPFLHSAEYLLVKTYSQDPVVLYFTAMEFTTLIS